MCVQKEQTIRPAVILMMVVKLMVNAPLQHGQLERMQNFAEDDEVLFWFVHTWM